MPGKLESRWEEGVYMGFVIRTGEDLVATENGVFRVSTIRRRPSDERWSKELIDRIVGSPAVPVPALAGRKIPVYAKKFAASDGSREQSEFAAPPPVPESTVRSWKIYKRDVDDNGITQGCAGCRAIERNASWKAAHTPECRLRFEAILSGSEEGRQRLARADERIAHEILRKQGIDPYAEGTDKDQEGGGKEATAEEAASPDDPGNPRCLNSPSKAVDSETQRRNDERFAKLRAEVEARKKAGKRKADEPTEDGSRPREVRPEATAANSQGEQRGEKRSADEAVHPDDPRGNDTGQPDISSIGACRLECGCCSEKFDSRNQLFKHLREERHVVISDDEEEMTEGPGQNHSPPFGVAKPIDNVAKLKRVPGTQASPNISEPKTLSGETLDRARSPRRSRT